MKKLRILLSNDDGIAAPGLMALYRAVEPMAEVWAVAPDAEQSSCGHNLSLSRPLRIRHLGERFYSVDGSPADCILVGIHSLLRRKPDWVISGINATGNLGQDLYYSGTLAAAREACIQGVPSIAVSLLTELGNPTAPRYKTAARVVTQLLEQRPNLPSRTLLNVNVPNLPFARLAATRYARLGMRDYRVRVAWTKDVGRDRYVQLRRRYLGFCDLEGSDCHAAQEGHVVVTPVALDATDPHSLELLSRDEW